VFDKPPASVIRNSNKRLSYRRETNASLDLYQLKCCPAVVHITHTDPRVSLSSTFSNCHVLFDYLHSSLQVQLSHSEHATLRVSSTDFHTTNLVNVNCMDSNCDHQTSTTTKVVNVDDTAYSSASTPLWTRTTVADGHKFSVGRRFSRSLLDFSTRVPGLSCGVVFEISFDTKPACNGQTDELAMTAHTALA